MQGSHPGMGQRVSGTVSLPPKKTLGRAAQLSVPDFTIILKVLVILFRETSWTTNLSTMSRSQGLIPWTHAGSSFPPSMGGTATIINTV